MSEFHGKTVLVTGAGRGIGRAIATGFAAEGANLCINYAHSKDEAEAAVAEIRAAGGHAIACQADIADAAQVSAMVEAAIDAFDSIDVLVNNAGLSIDGPFLDMSEQDWDRVYAERKQVRAAKRRLSKLRKHSRRES